MKKPIFVVTTWSPNQADTFGRLWLEGTRYWPEKWRPIVYGQPPRSLHTIIPKAARSRIEFRPERGTDVERFRATSGRSPAEITGHMPKPSWRIGELDTGYSFRTDAVRFAWKVYTILDVIETAPDGATIVWLDADVWTKRPIENPHLWDDLLPPEFDVGWLNRPAAWAETGCLIFRTPGALVFATALRSIYDFGLIFTKAQWHDGWVIGQLLTNERKRFNAEPIVTSPAGDIWAQSRLLSDYFTHEKGFSRKIARYGHIT